MKHMVLAGIVLLATGAVAGSATAADLGRQYQQPYVKAPIYNPMFTWTGFYLGVNGGGGWGQSSWDRTGNFNLSGGVIGGTAGFNWQTGQVVLGIEGDIDWSGVTGTTATLCPAGCVTRNDWLGTARGRVGYAFDRFLPYVTGGLAVGDVKGAITSPPVTILSGTNAQAGWALGAGIEYAFTPSLSAKAEYLYVDLGSSTPVPGDSVELKSHVVRGGLNWRFNWDGPRRY